MKAEKPNILGPVHMMGFRTDAKPGQPFWMGDLNWSGTQCGIDGYSPEGEALKIGEIEFEDWAKVTCPKCLAIAEGITA